MVTMDPSADYLLGLKGFVNSSIIEPRQYQINISKSIESGRNTLVVLPTGLGKTLIAIFAIAQALKSGKRALILAPTKPLSQQHHASLTKFLAINGDLILLLTGSIGAKRRMELESSAKVIAATPQTVANDISSGRITLSEYGVVIFDECHKAVGKYAYTSIADHCKELGVQLVGLTASPGSDRKKIGAIISEMGIRNIQVRVSSDPDVSPYVMGKDTHVYYVEKGELIDQIIGNIRPLIDEHLSNLYSHGLSPFKSFDNLAKGRLLQIGDTIGKLQAQKYKFMALFNYIYVLNLAHAHDMVASEGIGPFLDYMESLNQREKKSRAVQSILNNPNIGKAIAIAKEMQENGQEHPKMAMVVDLLKGDFNNKTVIVFAQFKSTIRALTKVLAENGLKAKSFTGKQEGFSQNDQRDVIDEFRRGDFNILVATSIGEEGLDIPSVDCVIFYEPIPSAVRNIQRRGRAGRMKFGDVVILVAKRTKDEAYLMISRMREKRMKELLEQMKLEIESRSVRRHSDPGQQNAIRDFIPGKPI
jgi:ERCC4-related helicase